MSLLLKRMVQGYIHARDDLKDPRTSDWFLVHSPVPVIFISFVYFVTVTEWLPRFMENREAYNLRRLLVYYNILQIALNSYIVVRAALSLHTLRLKCSAVDYSGNAHAMNFAGVVWLYFMVKLVDMLDTVFFVLRKKDHQVSFLHVYHHAGVLVVGWLAAKYVPGGEAIHLGFLNSFVHVVMYSYYLFAAWMPEKKVVICKWKKHVTQLQLMQFMILFCLYAPKLFTDCEFPKFLLGLFIPQTLVMIAMFGDFYYQTYIKASKNIKNL